MIEYIQKRQWLDFFTLIVVCILCVMLDGAVGLVIGVVFRMAIKKKEK